MTAESRPCEKSDPARGETCRGIWVFADLRNERTTEATASLVSKAEELALKAREPLSVVLLGDGIGKKAREFFKWGADSAYLMEHALLSRYLQETYTTALFHLVTDYRPSVFLFLANDCGRELAPRLAARLNTGLCADCVELDIDPDTGLLLQTVPAFGDNVCARILTPRARPQMATVRPGIFAPGAPSHKKEEIRFVPFPAETVNERVRWLDGEPSADEGKALEDARLVVCGGRGMGSAEHFQVLWDFATLIGAEVGGSRPAVHAHWISLERMIGQTGVTIAPDVLMLFGISGAVQFTASIQKARYIIAVNKDERAPIFCSADLGIVGDAPHVVAALLQRTRRTLTDRYGTCPGDIKEKRKRVQGSLGDKLETLRRSRGLSLEGVAQSVECTSEYLEKIERNEVSPSVSFLLRIAHVLAVDPAPLLTMAEGLLAEKRRAESFLKRTQSYSYRTLTPGAENKHLRAFLVTIDPKKDHKMVEYRHEGEEFVYVVKGEVEIKVGEEIRTLNKGESLHFEASIPHNLTNRSSHLTELVVVLYTP